MREPAPIKLTIHTYELENILKINVQGGQATLRGKLLAKLTPNTDHNYEGEFSDAEIGELIRQMSYGGGGWQNALRRTFLRAILKIIKA